MVLTMILLTLLDVAVAASEVQYTASPRVYCRWGQLSTGTSSFDHTTKEECQAKCDERDDCVLYLSRGNRNCQLRQSDSSCKHYPKWKSYYTMYKKIQKYTSTPDMYCAKGKLSGTSSYTGVTKEQCEAKCDARADCELYLWRTQKNCHLRVWHPSCKASGAKYTLYRKTDWGRQSSDSAVASVIDECLDAAKAQDKPGNAASLYALEKGCELSHYMSDKEECYESCAAFIGTNCCKCSMSCTNAFTGCSCHYCGIYCNKYLDAYPTPSPTAVPTALPTPIPTAIPTPIPTAIPTPIPTAIPTPIPTAIPTPIPTAIPTPIPTAIPTAIPTPQLTRDDVFCAPVENVHGLMCGNLLSPTVQDKTVDECRRLCAENPRCKYALTKPGWCQICSHAPFPTKVSDRTMHPKISATPSEHCAATRRRQMDRLIGLNDVL